MWTMVREIGIVCGEGTCPVQHGKTISWFVISLQMLEKENNKGSNGSLNSGTKLEQEQTNTNQLWLSEARS